MSGSGDPGQGGNERRTLYNPQIGQRVTFLTTARESDGQLLRMEFVMDPEGHVAAEHIHPHQEERFEVASGTVRMRIDGVERDASVGEVVVVPSGVSHVWWNAGRDPAHVLAELRPALRTEEFIETLAAWVSAGLTSDGVPTSLLRQAVLAHEYRREVRPVPQKGVPVSRLPRPLMTAVVAYLAGLGRLLGYRARLDSARP